MNEKDTIKFRADPETGDIKLEPLGRLQLVHGGAIRVVLSPDGIKLIMPEEYLEEDWITHKLPEPDIELICVARFTLASGAAIRLVSYPTRLVSYPTGLKLIIPERCLKNGDVITYKIPTQEQMIEEIYKEFSK